MPARPAIVFASTPGNVIHAFDLDSGKRLKLIPGTEPHVTTDGELVFYSRRDPLGGAVR